MAKSGSSSKLMLVCAVAVAAAMMMVAANATASSGEAPSTAAADSSPSCDWSRVMKVLKACLPAVTGKNPSPPKGVHGCCGVVYANPGCFPKPKPEPEARAGLEASLAQGGFVRWLSKFKWFNKPTPKIPKNKIKKPECKICDLVSPQDYFNLPDNCR